MNADTQKLYDALNNMELTRGHLFSLSCALKEVADAIGERSAYDALRHTTNALRYLNEFRGSLISTPTLDADEAELSAGMHTYMRKCMDDALGTILYRLIAEDRGKNVWYAFVKEVHKSKYTIHSYDNAIAAAKNVVDIGNDTTDDMLMYSALEMWADEFSEVLDWIFGKKSV